VRIGRFQLVQQHCKLVVLTVEVVVDKERVYKVVEEDLEEEQDKEEELLVHEEEEEVVVNT
jgi:hypothetical protein